jgi:ATP synthase protein I
MTADNDEFAKRVAAKVRAKLRAQRAAKQPAWFGLGTLGIIGWSVATPTLLGALVGRWCDRHYPGPHSWTLALLVAGLILGCANAWHWVSNETKALREPEDDV